VKLTNAHSRRQKTPEIVNDQDLPHDCRLHSIVSVIWGIFCTWWRRFKFLIHERLQRAMAVDETDWISTGGNEMD
jgi:hypothetical protein